MNRMIDFVENLRDTFPDGMPELGTPEYLDYMNQLNARITESTPDEMDEFKAYSRKVLGIDK